MATTPEGRVKVRIKRILADAGVYYFMPVGTGWGRIGIPDFVACVNGRFLAIEAKAGTGKTTALQNRELQMINDAGGVALVVYDHEEHFTHLQTMLKALNANNI